MAQNAQPEQIARLVTLFTEILSARPADPAPEPANVDPLLRHNIPVELPSLLRYMYTIFSKAILDNAGGYNPDLAEAIKERSCLLFKEMSEAEFKEYSRDLFDHLGLGDVFRGGHTRGRSEALTGHAATIDDAARETELWVGYATRHTAVAAAGTKAAWFKTVAAKLELYVDGDENELDVAEAEKLVLTADPRYMEVEAEFDNFKSSYRGSLDSMRCTAQAADTARQTRQLHMLAAKGGDPGCMRGPEARHVLDDKQKETLPKPKAKAKGKGWRKKNKAAQAAKPPPQSAQQDVGASPAPPPVQQTESTSSSSTSGGPAANTRSQQPRAKAKAKAAAARSGEQ